MGMSSLQEITNQLISHGRDETTPAAVIQWASRKQQKTVTGTLATIFEQAQKAKLEPPSLIVIGNVVNRRKDLNFSKSVHFFIKHYSPLFKKKKYDKLFIRFRGRNC